ncbi:LppM family (lipo)protein [Glycomyces xiaoerkulensis]|uniref:LppM family (lipo)protein n=1 Tax=Glycomyces xiaoerkulensis TaxID=2038139 RepID=UPI000C259E3B|nr:hypothetical protein [Glycomyces xiaoerkulensis]
MLGLARRLASAVAAIAVLAASGGCMRLELDLEVRPDETVGGTFTIAWSEEFLDEVRSGEASVSESDLEAFMDAVLEGAPGADREPYRSEGFVGRTASFTGRPLSEFAESTGEEWGFLRITREDRRYLLEARWDLRPSGFLDPGEFEDARFLVSATFPGRVGDHNGELEGRTVTWRMTPGQDYELHAEAVKADGWAYLWAGLASLAAVLALLWLWQWFRIRKHSTGMRR